MKTRRTFLSMLGLSACIGLSAAFAAPPPATSQPKAMAKIGEKAPEFTLKDTAGKEHKLSDFKGKIVVLEWINPECPYCNFVCKEGGVAKMQKQLKEVDKDIVFLAINSTNYHDAKKTAAYLKETKLTMPGLVDQDGKVGHMYGAKTTPHMFVIDTEGVLRYEGAIDDNKNKDKENPTNHVVVAVQQIKAGETVTPDKTIPYGCTVKYAAK